MSAIKILLVRSPSGFAIALIALRGATQWTAWRLGFQPQLGRSWFELWPGIPVYIPPAFFTRSPIAPFRHSPHSTAPPERASGLVQRPQVRCCGLRWLRGKEHRQRLR
jgi:hypothetical protein